MWGGKPGQIVDLVTERVIEAVTSEALIVTGSALGYLGLRYPELEWRHADRQSGLDPLQSFPLLESGLLMITKGTHVVSVNHCPSFSFGGNRDI